jgi:hypothetical protein
MRLWLEAEVCANTRDPRRHGTVNLPESRRYVAGRSRGTRIQKVEDLEIWLKSHLVA